MHCKLNKINCVCLSMCARVVRVNVTSFGVKCVSQMKSHVSLPADGRVASHAGGQFLNLYSQST